MEFPNPNSMGNPNFIRFLVIFILISISMASIDDSSSTHFFPRPLILEYTQKIPTSMMMTESDSEAETELQCTSWRFAVEANNLNPWKNVPAECAGYVREYMNGKGYGLDLDRTSREAAAYARGVEIGSDGLDVWVFDVDETLLSNLPYYAEHGYGLTVFDAVAFDKWVDKAIAPAVEASLKLYEEVLSLGIKVFLLTGRSEQQRNVTVQNLLDVGFKNWEKLILRSSDDHGKPATVYKSQKRNELVNDGYRIIGNSGDQWSDLLGYAMSVRSFKLPNPMYYIA